MSETNSPNNEDTPVSPEVSQTPADTPSQTTQPPEKEEIQNIDIVLDIPVTLSMELGRTRISIRELLKLKSGSVVELPKMADEPMDVLVNGTLVARGEAVVVDDKFGIRLTDVISPMERVKRLK
jgi:flagellar motor switch protein FliN/FliY